MQLTYEAAWYPSETQTQLVQAQMRQFQSVKRIAFKRLLEGQNRQMIVDTIRQLGLLSNARYIRSAIKEAKGTIQAQHELVKLYCKESAWKVQETSQCLKKYHQKLNREYKPLTKKQYQKFQGFRTRYQKALSNHIKWTTHRNNKTIPRIVFGGKKILQLYQQGKISKKEWTQRRNNGIYCVGEKNQQGNANLRIQYDRTSDSFSFSFLMDRGNRNERIQAPLFVPSKFKEIFKRYSQGTKAYTVRILRSRKGTHFRVLVASEHENSTSSNNNGIAGLDLNPTGIAVTLLHPDGNFRASRWFQCPDLMYARKKKRNWLLGNLVKEVFEWIASHQINTLSVEGLRFSQKYGSSRAFNRVKSNFVYQKLINTIYSHTLRKNFCVKAINPAFTSLIGKFKYRKRYGLNHHQAAALVIGRRGLGFHERLYDHDHSMRVGVVVPPMEGWTSTQIARLARDIDEFTARLSNSTGKGIVGPPTILTRRQGSGGGIVPRSHTPTSGTGASGPPGVYHGT